MKPIRPLIALTLLWVACSEPPAPRAVPPPPPPTAGALLEVHGTVTLTRGEGPAQPAAPQPLFAGDVLITGPDSSAVLRSSDGATIELDEDTRFRVGDRPGGLTLELLAGSISVVDTEDGGQGLKVQSPFGATQLSRGAKANLAIGAAGLSVSVALGTITLEAEDGGQQVAAAGQKLIVKVGSIAIVDEAPAEAVDTTLPAIQFVLTREAGKPMLKVKGNARFSAVPGKPTPIAEGASFQLPAGARARLSAKGISVALAPGSTGSLGASTVGPAGRTVELKLTSGSTSTLFDGSTPTTLKIIGAKKELQLVSTGEAAVTIVQSPAGPRLEVQAGEVAVVADGKSIPVKAGERADLSGASPVVTARPRPLLVLPVDRGVRVFATKGGDVGLALPREQAARVQVAADASFASPILSGPVTDSLVVVQAPLTGDLHWQVLDASGTAIHKGHARFAPDRDRAAPVSKARSEVAETGLKALVSYQSELPELAFTFPAREGAKRYRLRIYRAAELTKPIVEREVTETRCIVEAGLLVEGSYVWYAAPLDEKRNEKAGGRMNKLDIEFANTLTSLIITRPRLDGPADSTAAGTAPLTARLFINAKLVMPDSEGRFSVPLAGAEAAVFRLVERNGDESYWVRRVSK